MRATLSERRRITIAATALAFAVLIGVPQLLHAQDWRTISQSRQAGDETALRVDVEYAAGELRLGQAAAGSLYRMTMRYDDDLITPRVAYRNGRLSVGMENTQIKGRSTKGGFLDLKLGASVPLDLHLKFGAAEANLDLGGMHVSRAAIATGASSTKLTVSAPNAGSCDLLELEVGAARFEATRLGNLNARRMTMHGGVGEVTLDFTGQWQQDMIGKIDMGLGSLTLRLPRGLGVSIRKGGLLASFDSQGLVKRGDVHYSENWDSATHKLSLEINAALGSINVVWVDSQ
ncbi:hypothetical protein BH23GEM10_BH23GEM10_09990 [soil metagenome]